MSAETQYAEGRQIKVVYLLCRRTQGTLPDTHHAEHYLGESDHGGYRIQVAHRRNRNGSRLVRHWNENGAEYVVARLWETKDPRGLEHRLKARTPIKGRRNADGSQMMSGSKNSRAKCPVCKSGIEHDLLPVGIVLGGVKHYTTSLARKGQVTRLRKVGWDHVETWEDSDGFGLVWGQKLEED